MGRKIEPTEDMILELHEKYKGQFVIDFEKGQQRFEEIPTFWSRLSLLYAFYKEVQMLVGTMATHLLMAKVTRPHGRTFVKFAREFKGEMSRDDILMFMAADFLATGWGKLYFELEDDGRIMAVAPQGFPLGQQFVSRGTRTIEPVDHYFMGYFEGALAEVDGVDYKGEEPECIAKGDKRCVFVFKKVDRN